MAAPFTKGFLLNLQPWPAWMAILGLVFFSAVTIFAGVGSILRFIFPLGSLAVGIFLYCWYPILYISFTWWIWFLTPFIRRVIDFKSGWDPQGIILVSPYLVALVTLITFARCLPKVYRIGGLPFLLALVSVFYGSLIGLVQHSTSFVVKDTLDWLVPILFGFHLFANWRDYPKLKQNFQRTFFWCVLVTGTYGIVQYLIAPEWDRLWIIGTGIATNGIPEPLGIRVFSTMNSPLPFAVVTMAGLLLMFSSQKALRIPAAVVGYLSLLLSLVRTAWGGWLVGLLTLLTSLKENLQIRLVVSISVMAICIIPLTNVSPFSDVISSRLETVTSIEGDSSFEARSARYEEKTNLALSQSLGNGMGSFTYINEQGILQNVVFDSGILQMFFTLGWLGTIPYLGGLALLMYNLFQGSEACHDTFASAARAITLATFAQLPLGSVMLSLSGMVLWGFLGIGIAARKYYLHQQTMMTHRN